MLPVEPQTDYRICERHRAGGGEGRSEGSRIRINIPNAHTGQQVDGLVWLRLNALAARKCDEQHVD